MRTRPFCSVALMAACAGVALPGADADATWSILIGNCRTGEIAVGSATCLIRTDLRGATPVLVTGVGAATGQASGESTGRNRTFIRDRFADGVDSETILTMLESFDGAHQSRQYGIIDLATKTPATFSGANNFDWAGGVTGRVGDLIYAVQGNILTGEAVVLAAEDAILTTPGGLADKLMASMEAAYAFGGDGRCSCPGGGGPTSCGAPPDDFTKSAHVGYMLIGRAGDQDACNGTYAAGGIPYDVAHADLDADGDQDLVATSTGGTAVTIFENTTEPGDLFVSLNRIGAVGAAGGLRGVLVAELTGDSILDISASSVTTDSVVVIPGLGGFAFDAPMTYAVGDNPLDVVAGDFDGANGLDLATCNSVGDSVSILLSDGAGGFGAATNIPLGSNPNAIAVADFFPGSGDDLVVTDGIEDVARLLRNDGTGAFTVDGDPIATGEEPIGVEATDFDDDARMDFATANDDGDSVSVHTRTDAGFDRADVALPDGARDLGIGDVDGDSDPDIFVLRTGFPQLSILTNDAGTLSIRSEHPFVGGDRMAVADLGRDGFPEAASGNRNIGAVRVIDNFAGTFGDATGCAGGDYYMTFNVALSEAADLDPVLQLRQMFDDWDGALVGRPDAILSTVSLVPSIVASTGSSGTTMRVVLRDRGGVRLSTSPAMTVEHGPGSDGVTEIGAVVPVGAGEYHIDLTALAGIGRDRFVVRVDDGVRPVVLMPAPAISVVSPDADITGDLVVDIFDILGFLALFDASDPDADIAEPFGTWDLADLVAYLELFAGG